MRSIALLLVILYLTTLSSAFIINNCTETGTVGILKDVEISDCPLSMSRCILKRGTNVTLTVKFETTKEVQKVNQTITAFIPTPAPFNVHSDACIDTGLKCPLPVGENTYTYSVFVKEEYPRVRVLNVKWQIADIDSNLDVVCLEIPAAIR